jgi:hypothetical protein
MKLTSLIGGKSPEVKAASVAIAERLRLAEANLAELEAQREPLALADVTGVDGAGVKLASLIAKIRSSREEVEKLAGAHREAFRREEQAAVDARGKQRLQQFDAISAHAKDRLQAAAELAAALETAAKALAKMVAAHEKLLNAAPDGTALPETSLNLSRAVSEEIFRVCGVTHPDDPRLLPAGRPPDFTLWQQPSTVTPLVDAIADQNQFIVSAVKAQISGAAA